MENEQSVADFVATEVNLVRASTGKRLANFIIDIIVFYIIIIVLLIPLAIISPETFTNWVDNNNSSVDIASRILFLFCYAIIMGITEAAFKGKSIGKLITRTRAVNFDGSRISTATAFARGFSRAVPFCAFSALTSPCNPWQDRWTDTLVIDERESETGI